MATRRRRLWWLVLAVVLFAGVLYAIAGVILGSLGMDIHWRGFGT